LKELEMRGCSPTINIRKCLSAAALKRWPKCAKTTALNPPPPTVQNPTQSRRL
jgi:hypothetical protein